MAVAVAMLLRWRPTFELTNLMCSSEISLHTCQCHVPIVGTSESSPRSMQEHNLSRTIASLSLLSFSSVPPSILRSDRDPLLLSFHPLYLPQTNNAIKSLQQNPRSISQRRQNSASCKVQSHTHLYIYIYSQPLASSSTPVVSSKHSPRAEPGKSSRF